MALQNFVQSRFYCLWPILVISSNKYCSWWKTLSRRQEQKKKEVSCLEQSTSKKNHEYEVKILVENLGLRPSQHRSEYFQKTDTSVSSSFFPPSAPIRRFPIFENRGSSYLCGRVKTRVSMTSEALDHTQSACSIGGS